MFTLFFAFITVMLIIKLNEIIGMNIGFQKSPNEANGDENDVFVDANISSEDETEKQEIYEYCPDFNEARFLRITENVFKTVFDAYAAGDKDTLKQLLSPKIYRAFVMAIDDRASKGEKLSGSIERMVSVKIDNTKIENNEMYIDVRFVSEQTNILRNANGAIIEGSEDFINTSTEIWTFSRPIDSTEKQWYLSNIRYESEK